MSEGGNTEQNTEKKKRELPEELKANIWKPGQSGNPSGRPKKKWLTEVYEELLEEKLSDPEFRKQFKESQWAKLMSPKVVGAMTLDKAWERTEGKIKEELHVTGEVALTLSERMKKARERSK